MYVQCGLSRNSYQLVDYNYYVRCIGMLTTWWNCISLPVCVSVVAKSYAIQEDLRLQMLLLGYSNIDLAVIMHVCCEGHKHLLHPVNCNMNMQ